MTNSKGDTNQNFKEAVLMLGGQGKGSLSLRTA